jgi:hypothetical protein
MVAAMIPKMNFIHSAFMCFSLYYIKKSWGKPIAQQRTNSNSTISKEAGPVPAMRPILSIQISLQLGLIAQLSSFGSELASPAV